MEDGELPGEEEEGEILSEEANSTPDSSVEKSRQNVKKTVNPDEFTNPEAPKGANPLGEGMLDVSDEEIEWTDTTGADIPNSKETSPPKPDEAGSNPAKMQENQRSENSEEKADSPEPPQEEEDGLDKYKDDPPRPPGVENSLKTLAQSVKSSIESSSDRGRSSPSRSDRSSPERRTACRRSPPVSRRSPPVSRRSPPVSRRSPPTSRRSSDTYKRRPSPPPRRRSPDRYDRGSADRYDRPSRRDSPELPRYPGEDSWYDEGPRREEPRQEEPRRHEARQQGPRQQQQQRHPGPRHQGHQGHQPQVMDRYDMAERSHGDNRRGYGGEEPHYPQSMVPYPDRYPGDAPGPSYGHPHQPQPYGRENARPYDRPPQPDHRGGYPHPMAREPAPYERYPEESYNDQYRAPHSQAMESNQRGQYMDGRYPGPATSRQMPQPVPPPSQQHGQESERDKLHSEVYKLVKEALDQDKTGQRQPHTSSGHFLDELDKYRNSDNNYQEEVNRFRAQEQRGYGGQGGYQGEQGHGGEQGYGGQGGYQGDQGGYRADQGGYRGDQGGYRADQGGYIGDQGGYRGDQGYTGDDVSNMLDEVYDKANQGRGGGETQGGQSPEDMSISPGDSPRDDGDAVQPPLPPPDEVELYKQLAGQPPPPPPPPDDPLDAYKDAEGDPLDKYEDRPPVPPDEEDEDDDFRLMRPPSPVRSSSVSEVSDLSDSDDSSIDSVEGGKTTRAKKLSTAPSSNTGPAPQFLSFISGMLKNLNPDFDEEKLREVIMPKSATAAKPKPQAKPSSSSEMYDPSEPTQPVEIEIPHFGFCPLCNDDFTSVPQQMPLPQIQQLKEHVLAYHLPWYACVTTYNKDGDGGDFRRCKLADQLHPVLLHSVTTMENMASFFIRLWGKLLHGYLVHLSQLMGLQNAFQLEMTVMMKKLHPVKGLISDLSLNMANEEKIMINAHQTFVNDFQRELDVSPPNCLSACLHWVTLVNVIRELPKEKREAVNTYNPFTPGNLCKLPPSTSNAPYNHRELVRFWEQVLVGGISNCVEIACKQPAVLAERHHSGYGAVQLALGKRHYHLARALLFCGASPDMQTQNGWYPLSHFAHAGDAKAVQVLLAWGARAELRHALHQAETAKHTQVVKLLHQKLGIAAYGPPEEEEEEAGDPAASKVMDMLSLVQSKSVRAGIPQTLKPPELEQSGKQLDQNSETCELCNKTISEDMDQKSHFVSVHLPWYIAVNHTNTNGSHLYKCFRPALNSYVKQKQVPFELFGKMWGRLIHGFLKKLATLLKLEDPADLVWFVTQKRFTPPKGTEPSFVDKIMMKTLQLHIGEDEKEMVLSPPNCLGAVLHWTSLSNLLALLSAHERQQLATYEKEGDIESLRRNLVPHGYKRGSSSEQSLSLKKSQFWTAIVDGQMTMLWKLILDHEDFVNLYGDTDSDYCPVQCAITNSHYSTARLLMCFGSTTDRRDMNGFTPLWRAAASGELDTVHLLLPWVRKEQKLGAISAARRGKHEEIARVIKKFLSKEGVIKCSKRPAEDSSGPVAKRGKYSQQTGASIPSLSGFNSMPPMEAITSAEMLATTSSSSSSIPPTSIPGGFLSAHQFPPPSSTPAPGDGTYVPPFMQFTQKPPDVALSVDELKAIVSKAASVNQPDSMLGNHDNSHSHMHQQVSLEEEEVHLPPGQKDHAAQSAMFVCSMCDQKFLDTMSKKYHVTMSHLPWYFAMKFHKDERFVKTKLARQFLPHLGGSFDEDCKTPPFGLFFKLLGKLFHGFLEMMSSYLGLRGVDDLIEFTRVNRLYPHKQVEVMSDDKLIIRAHRDYTGDVKKNISTSPPNCLSALLHWTTVCNLASMLPPPAKLIVHNFERYDSANIIDKKSGDASRLVTPEKIIQMQRSILDNNLYHLWELLDESPQLAVTSMMTIDGISPTEFALDNGRYDAAAVLCFYGAIVDQPNVNGWTALKSAAKKGNIEGAAFLLNWGSSYQLQESVDTAKISGHHEIVRLLRNEVAERKKLSKTAESIHTDNMMQMDSDGLLQDDRCPICREELSTDHPFINHLPWYATLQWPSRGNKDVLAPNMTMMGLRMVKMASFNQRRALPPQFLVVIGKLLHDMLDYIMHKLELVSHEALLQYVVKNRLYDPRVPRDDRALTNVIVPAYQLYTETQGHAGFNPPNCVPAILHWRTLLNLFSRLSRDAQMMLYTYETFKWDKKYPTLPSIRGAKPQPANSERDAGRVPHLTRQSFLELITFGYKDVTHVSSLVEHKPALVFCDTRSRSGVIQHILYYSKIPSPSTEKAKLFKLLVLTGAPTDVVDYKGWTALHIAAMKNDLFAATLLLVWDANHAAKGPYGQRPLDIARKRGNLDIVHVLELAEKGFMNQILAFATAERMNNCRRAAQGRTLSRPSPQGARKPMREFGEDEDDDDDDNDGGFETGGHLPQPPPRDEASPSVSTPSSRGHVTHGGPSTPSYHGPARPSTPSGPPPPSADVPWLAGSSTPAPGATPQQAPPAATPHHRNKCPLCTNQPYNMAHVLYNHFPWYAGLQCKWPNHKPDQRRTHLYMRMMRGIYIGEKRKKSLPLAFQVIIGKLLHDMLDFMAAALGLMSQKALLQYVLDQQLWSRMENRREDIVLYDITIAALHTHLGISGQVATHNPPNCSAGLLHWETLLNVLCKMPQESQEKLKHLETFMWCKENPSLPLAHGNQRQPNTHETDGEKGVPYFKKQEFLRAIQAGRCDDVMALIDHFPQLVYLKGELPKREGIISVGITSNKNPSVGGKCLLAKILLLHGAPLDAADSNGNTALHHAVALNLLQPLITLVLWEASLDARNIDGKTPAALATGEGLMDMVRIFEYARRASYQEVYAIPSEMNRDCTSNKMGSSGGSIFSSSGEVIVRRGGQTADNSSSSVSSVSRFSDSRKRPYDSPSSRSAPAAGKSFKPDDGKWRCPVCDTATYSGRLHALESHLPWYVSIGADFKHLITGRRKTKMALKLAPGLIQVAYCKDFTAALEFDNTRIPCFVQLLGKLYHGLLSYIAHHLGLSQVSDLLQYVKRKKLWPETQASMLPVDVYGMKTFQIYIEEEKTDTQVAPPNHVSGLLYWHTLLNLVAQLPEPCQREIRTFENYEMTVSDMTITCQEVEGKQQLNMAFRQPLNIPSVTRSEFFSSIVTNQLHQLCRLLDDWPNLVYCSVPRQDRAGPVWFALNHEKHVAAHVLYMYGAHPDHLDGRGWTALHNVIKKGDFKGVQVLLALDASLDLKTPEGMTPLDLAKKMGRSRITSLIAEKIKQREKERIKEAEREAEKHRDKKLVDTPDGRKVEMFDVKMMQGKSPWVLGNQLASGTGSLTAGGGGKAKPWKCAVCNRVVKDGNGRAHAAQHLPWYVIFTSTEVDEKQSSTLYKMLAPILSNSLLMKRTPPAEVFLRIWGKLLAALLDHICSLVGATDHVHLTSLMTRFGLWPSADIFISYSDKMAGMALKRSTEPQQGQLTLKEPYSVLDLVHWSSLINLLSLVPGPLRRTVATFDEYKLPEPECHFSPYTRPEISKVYMRMTSPQLDRIAAPVKDDFVSNVKKGRMDAMCRILDRQPKLVYLPFSEFENAGVISVILDGNDQDMAVAARLYGADPDYRDKLGMTALHRFASRDHTRMVKFLLTLGASPLLTLTDGKTTPALLAAEKGCKKVLPMLQAEESKRRKVLMAAAMPEGGATNNTDSPSTENTDKLSEAPADRPDDNQTPPPGAATTPATLPADTTEAQPMDTTEAQPMDTGALPGLGAAADVTQAAVSAAQLQQQQDLQELQQQEVEDVLSGLVGQQPPADPSQPPPRLLVIEPGANFDDLESLRPPVINITPTVIAPDDGDHGNQEADSQDGGIHRDSSPPTTPGGSSDSDDDVMAVPPPRPQSPEDVKPKVDKRLLRNVYADEAIDLEEDGEQDTTSAPADTTSAPADTTSAPADTTPCPAVTTSPVAESSQTPREEPAEASHATESGGEQTSGDAVPTDQPADQDTETLPVEGEGGPREESCPDELNQVCVSSADDEESGKQADAGETGTEGEVGTEEAVVISSGNDEETGNQGDAGETGTEGEVGTEEAEVISSGNDEEGAQGDSAADSPADAGDDSHKSTVSSDVTHSEDTQGTADQDEGSGDKDQTTEQSEGNIGETVSGESNESPMET